MIKYSLRCDQAHEFESWFSDSASFDMQKKRGFVSCPLCSSTKIEKQIMAPRVVTAENRAPAEPEKLPQAPPQASQPMAMLGDEARAMREMIRAFRSHVNAHTEDVGKGFVDEARKMHSGESEQRAIRGEASLADARDLHEEGIAVMPLPILPDERN